MFILASKNSENFDNIFYVFYNIDKIHYVLRTEFIF